MSKIDWTKPIETLKGEPATLIAVLDRSQYPYVVVVDHKDKQRLYQLTDKEESSEFAGRSIRNVAPPLKLYGRLTPRWGGDIQGMTWTIHQGRSDTHVMEIPANRLNEFIKPL